MIDELYTLEKDVEVTKIEVASSNIAPKLNDCL